MAIRIELEVDSKESDKRFDRLIDQLDAVERAQEVLKQALRTASGDAASAATGYDRLTRSMDRTARASKNIKPPPFVDPEAVREASRSGAASGDPRQMKLFEESHRQAKRDARIRKDAGGESMAELIERAFLRTRFDASGRGFPLGVDIRAIMDKAPQAIGQLFGGGKGSATFFAGGAPRGGAKAGPPPVIPPPVMGGAASSAGGGSAGALRMAAGMAKNPIGIAIAVAIAGIVAWTAALKFSMRKMREATQEALATGSRPGSTGALRLIAGMAGTSGSSLAGRVASGLESGPGLLVAGRAGVNPISNPLVGDIDMGEKVRKVTSAIMGASSFEEAQRMAMSVGAPELAQAYLLSKGNQKALATRTTSLTRGDMANVGDLQTGMARIFESFKKILSMPFRPMVAVIAKVVEFLNMLLDPIANVAQKIGDMATRGARKMLGLEDHDADGQSGARKTVNGVERALDENTGALNANTIALKEGRNVFGGGSRVRGAVPIALRYGTLDDFMHGERTKLGVL